jgi:hypothetical protein
VTLLTLLVRLCAVFDEEQYRKLLLEELAKGKSPLYGGCHILDSGNADGIKYQSYRAAFMIEEGGGQTAVLFTSQRNFSYYNPVPDTLPMGMPCSTYLEMIKKLEPGALRIDPGCFGEITLAASELPQITTSEAQVERDSLPGAKPTAPLPLPKPFRFSFQEQNSNYVAVFYPGSREFSAPDSEGSRVVTFGSNIDLQSLTTDGLAQPETEPWKELVVRHLNSDSGLRDGDFSGIRQLQPDVFMSRVMHHYAKILTLIGLNDWEVSPDNTTWKFKTAARAGGRKLLLEFKPRTRGKLSWTGASLPMNRKEIDEVLAFVRSNQDFISDLFDRHGILGGLGHVAPPPSEGFDVQSNKWKEQAQDAAALNYNLVMHMEVGLSPMDEEGAQRYARGLVCLHLGLLELAQRALPSTNE